MKTLLILRHAKAQPDAPHGDKKRALTERGLRDAAAMGHKLASLTGRIDLVVSSDAKRARQTAELAAEAAGYSGEIEYNADIYGAGLDALLDVVKRLPDSADCVVLVGHNPGFEDLAAELAAPGTLPPRLPTAGVARLEFDAASWRSAKPGTGRLASVNSPEDFR